MTVICATCGKKFEREKWRVKRSINQYCCRSCWAKSLENNVKLSCVYCGKLFKRALGEASKAQNHYCSKKCHFKDKKVEPVTKNCSNCGESVTRPQYEAKKSKKHFFCDVNCRLEYFKGKNHPRWAGGYRQYYGLIGINKKEKH